MVRTIRTCSLLALAAVLLPGPAMATRGEAEVAADYVRARLAGENGAPELAAAGYRTLLADAPGDLALALHAYRGALAAGDIMLALRAAASADAAGALPAEGRLLLAAEAIRAGDWRAARAAVARIDGDDGFGFLKPILNAWINFSAREGAAVALLEGGGDGLTAAYAGEHRALLLLADGKAKDGIAAMTALSATGQGVAGQAVRIAAAARLADLGARREARALLAGPDPVLAAARKDLGRMPTVDTAAEGIALLLTRLADDIARQRPNPLALSLLRIATHLDRDCAPALLLAAQRGGGAGDLAALERIGRGSPFRGVASDARIALLIDRDDRAQALAVAMATTRKGSAADWARLGALQVELGQPGEAVASFERALRFGEDWRLWLQLGAARERSGDWTGGEAALRKAHALAPDQPTVLNYLGYAQLERGQNLAEAEALIRAASKLRPGDAAITDSLGWAQFLRGETAAAIATLERAAEAAPGEAVIAEHLGDAYWKAGRRIDARYAWNAALAGAGEAERARLAAKLDFGPDAPKR